MNFFGWDVKKKGTLLSSSFQGKIRKVPLKNANFLFQFIKDRFQQG